MIWQLAVALLAVAALVYVTAPLRRREDAPDAAVPTDVAELYARKRAALRAILDVEEEAELGKLSHQELAELRQAYETEALVALRELDSVEHVSRGGDELEEEIARVRARLACPECGAPRRGERCSNCGAS